METLEKPALQPASEAAATADGEVKEGIEWGQKKWLQAIKST